METLPTELKTQIFTNMSDLSAVKSLNQVSISINKVFTSAKDLIICEVIKNSLDPDLLQEILAVVESFQMKPWSRERVSEILEEYFHSPPAFENVKWDSTSALQISKLHTVIQNLSADFASVALAKQCLTNVDGDTGSAATRSELRRFERNFWKFELYCNLFRKRGQYIARTPLKDILPPEQESIFFGRFSAFENEQLGCVHDYLWDQVSPAFADIASHDIEWAAEWSVGWVHDFTSADSSYQEVLLSRGLDELYKLRNAQTYEERHALLSEESCGPDTDDCFLVTGLAYRHIVNNGVPEQLRNLTLEQAKRAARKPSYVELDDGPFEAWKWAYETRWANSYFHHYNWIFRQRAYVMWDRNRLALWKLFETRRSDLPQELDGAYRPSPELVESELVSRHLRSEVYLSGGTGWWSADDTSKVQWPEFD